MKFLGREQELADNKFTPLSLINITPDDICRYFNYKAYGVEHPDDEAFPTQARSNTLKSCKKILSSFMPRTIVPWDNVRKEGNPTRSTQVNSLIKRVMKFEVRRLGVESQARRPIEYNEFINVLTIARINTQYKELERYKLGSVLVLQWHLIGRVDDMMKLQFADLSFNPGHPFCLICQMRWSKNIMEERQSPHQLVLASMDDRLCVLLNLAVYLELRGVMDGNNASFVYGNGSDGDRAIRALLKCALESNDFKKLISGNLGTHSIRKGPATYCSRNGVSKDKIESRGRWKSGKSQVDTYIDIDRPIPDAQVASCLCGPSGPIMYQLQDSDWCTDAFLCQEIAPNITTMLSPELGALLARPLVYAAMQSYSKNDSSFPLLPTVMREKIIQSIVDRGGYGTFDNIPMLVNRVPIIVGGIGDELSITPLEVLDTTTTPTTNATVNQNSLMREIVALHSTVLSTKRRLEEIAVAGRTDVDELRQKMQRGFDKLTSNVKRIAIQPVVRQVVDEVVDINRTTTHTASLSKRPRDLFELWKEYEFGTGRSKPAKDFTARERGTCKCVYSLRMNFWSQVERLIRRGYTSDSAIDAVYSVYGRSSSVTKILHALRRDKAGGGNPQLRN
jgi:hypothetical protein